MNSETPSRTSAEVQLLGALASTPDCSYNIQVQHGWDEAKRAVNLAKHGVDFAEAEGFDWSAALVRADVRAGYGEARLVAMAPIGDRLHVLVFTIRRRGLRIISLRRASTKELKRYEAEA
jgi:uncharacterized protein